jgi:hypothetical protein
MSVGDGFMSPMAAAPTYTTTAIGGDVTPRRRGKSKAPNFTYDGPVSVMRLEVDVSDPVVRRRVERQWLAVASAAAGTATRRRTPLPGVLGRPP